MRSPRRAPIFAFRYPLERWSSWRFDGPMDSGLAGGSVARHPLIPQPSRRWSSNTQQIPFYKRPAVSKAAQAISLHSSVGMLYSSLRE